MRPIRVALGRVSEMLRPAFVQVIRGETDMELLSDVTGPTDVAGLLGHEGADVVLIEENDDGASGTARQLLERCRHLRVLILSDDGRRVEAHWLEERRIGSSDVSFEGLLQLIRTACGREGGGHAH